MIREFLSNRRLLFFPKRWANSVTQWICGIHSPSGTLKIGNTASPSRGRSASFDVDIEAVWAKLRDLIDAEKRGDGGQNLRDAKDETFGDKIQSVAGADLTHDDITDWGTATADFLTDADMSAYALDADLSALEADVADIADVVEQIDNDLAALEDDFDDLYAALYDAEGKQKYVTTNTSQEITGNKYFRGGRGIGFVATGTNTEYQIYGGDSAIWWLCGGSYSKYILSANPVNDVLSIGNGLKVNVATTADNFTMNNHPTATASGTTSKAVATCGWAANLFSAKTHHHDEVYSKLGHTHSGYASTNHTHSGYASSNHNHAGVYADATHQHVASDITDLGNAVDAKINTFSNTLSGVYATLTEFDQLSSLVNEIDIDLADVIDYVDSLNEEIEDLADWYGTGASGTMKMCTGATWNGTKLAYTYRNITVSHGLITNIPASDMSADIDTPAVITWS